MKYQLLHNCTPEAFLLLSLKSFLSNRESWLKISTGPNQCGCFYDVKSNRQWSSSHDWSYGRRNWTQQKGWEDEVKFQRSVILCTVEPVTHWCSSGLWPHGHSHCKSHLQLLKLWLKYASAYAFCSRYEHTGIPPKDDEAQDDVCHSLCGSSAREFSQQQCD